MDKLVKFINVHVPVSNCTLRCGYCYVTIHETFGNTPPRLTYTPEFIRHAFRRERLGGCCHLNFCADGETMLLPELPAVVAELLKEGHYVSVVSNCTLTRSVERLASIPSELRRHLFVKASYHYLELERLNLLDVFFANVRLLRDAGIAVTVEVTPCDELMPHIGNAVELCKERMGAWPHFTVARDEHFEHLPILTTLPRDEYKDFWGKYGSALFAYKESVFGKRVRKFCYAGDWFLCVDLFSGYVSQCHGTTPFYNMYTDPDAPLPTKAIGCRCPREHCFNAHALLTQGVVPGIKSPTYAELRDRVTTDGSHWLTPEVASFFSQRLYDNNRQYPWYRRLYVNNRKWLRRLRTTGKAR